jgi:hypothetical protein
MYCILRNIHHLHSSFRYSQLDFNRDLKAKSTWRSTPSASLYVRFTFCRSPLNIFRAYSVPSVFRKILNVLEYKQHCYAISCCYLLWSLKRGDLLIHSLPFERRGKETHSYKFFFCWKKNASEANRYVRSIIHMRDERFAFGNEIKQLFQFEVRSNLIGNVAGLKLKWLVENIERTHSLHYCTIPCS